MTTLSLPNGFEIVPVEHSRFTELMGRVVTYAQLSPDPSTQNAAVLTDGSTVIRKTRNLTTFDETWAVNEFPRGVKYTDERWERPAKYSWISHAEENAILHAAWNKIGTHGLTMVCPWAACATCARLIIGAGIYQLVTLKPLTNDTNERWDASISIAMEMLAEAGVRVTFLEGSLGLDFTIRRNGEDVKF